MSRTAPILNAERGLAHYLWPPKWVGNVPDWAERGSETPPRPKELATVIAEGEFPDGLRCRVFRDGMLTFLIDDSLAYIERRHLGVRLMNAHLACLHCARPPQFTTSIVNPWSVMEVVYESGDFLSMNPRNDGGTVLSLHFARRPDAVDPNATVVDWRFFRFEAAVIPREAIERSFELFRALLERPAREKVLLRAELLLRAKVALNDGDNSGALTNAWTACEGMLGEMMARYVQDARKRNRGVSNSLWERRADFFTRGDWTIRHTVEVLFLADRLAFQLSEDARTCAKARNNWLHYEKEPDQGVAQTAIRVAGELFESLEQIPFHVGGNVPSDTREADLEAD